MLLCEVQLSKASNTQILSLPRQSWFAFSCVDLGHVQCLLWQPRIWWCDTWDSHSADSQRRHSKLLTASEHKSRELFPKGVHRYPDIFSVHRETSEIRVPRGSCSSLSQEAGRATFSPYHFHVSNNWENIVHHLRPYVIPKVLHYS